MPRYTVVRAFAEGLHIPMTNGRRTHAGRSSTETPNSASRGSIRT